MKRKYNPFGIFVLWLSALALTTICQSTVAMGHELMGEETIGNKPLNALNYTAWKDIMPVANHKSRVYHTWVNGDERFYYQGTIEQLNQLLADFGQLEQDVREIIILPGPGSVSNFDHDRTFGFNCEMHLVGGIAKYQTELDKGSLFWPLHPRLTIRLDDQFELGTLQIPANCQLISPIELKRRYVEGLTSNDKTIRGWGTSFLAGLNPYDRDSMNSIAGLLDDQDDWVALNAIATLGRFGNQARELLPRLEVIAQSEVQNNSQAAQKTIETIKTSDNQEQIQQALQDETEFRERLQVINNFFIEYDKRDVP